MIIENIAEGDKAGIDRAAAWHEDYARVLRDSITKRIEHGIGYGENLWRAEEHESAAFWLRQSIKEAK